MHQINWQTFFARLVTFLVRLAELLAPEVTSCATKSSVKTKQLNDQIAAFDARKVQSSSIARV